jgi:chromosome segregation ATPase
MREERADAKADLEAQLSKMEAKIEAEAAKAEQRAEAKMNEMAQLESKLREELAPSPAVNDDQLSALQARIGALHAAKMLSDDEVYALEDSLADYFDLLASVTVVTKDMATAQSEASKVLKLVVLSERMASDQGFARQCQRKFC